MKLVVGQKLKHRIAVDWGIGEVIAVSNNSYFVVNFEYGGKKTFISDALIQFEIIEPKPLSKTQEMKTIIEPYVSLHFDELKNRESWYNATHKIYVIELNIEVLAMRAFSLKNPDYKSGMRCFYVGITGLTPEKRFRNHKNGNKAARYVQKYGERLAYEFFAEMNPMPWEIARIIETKLTDRLKSYGFGVWQN